MKLENLAAKIKKNAMEVVNHMRVCLDEKGNKMFKPSEYLQQGQKSLFFRYGQSSTLEKQTIDDSDLESVIALLNSVEVI